MPYRYARVILLLLVFVAHSLSAQQPPPQQPPPSGQQPPPQAQAQPQPPGKVSGRVLRAEDGQPLRKTSVLLLPETRPNEGLSLRTDSRGVFEFLEVAPGRYRLVAERSGYVRQVYGQRGAGPGVVLTLAPGQNLERLEIRLERAGVISGNIRDEDNDPADGVEVRAQRVRFTPGGVQRATSARSVRTDDLGNYRISGLAPGFYYVQAGGRGGVFIGGMVLGSSFAAAYYPGVPTREESQRVQVSSGSEARGVDIALRSTPTYAITGLIIDARSGASPRRFTIGFATGGSTATTTVDRADGTFALRGMEPGEYTVVGSVSEENAGTRRGYRKVRIVDSDVKVVIEIGRTAEVRGEVRVEESQDSAQKFSFEGIVVNLAPAEENAIAPSQTIEDNGQFAARSIPEGQYTIQVSGRQQELYLKEARCAGEDYAKRPLTLAADQVVDDCTLTLARDVAQVNGVVTGKDDKPVTGAVVVLIPKEPERRKIARHNSTAQTDNNGVFQIRGAVPGEYFVYAVMPMDDSSYYDGEFPERNREAATTLTVKPSEPHTLNLKLTQPR